MEPKYYKHNLKNGLKILFIPILNSKFISVALQTNIGEDYETPNSKDLEIVHTLEHLFGYFTSKKYPNGKKNSFNLEKLGIDTQASVDEMSTNYSLSGNIKYMDMIIDIIYNTFSNFKIDTSIFEEEKLAIIQELNDIINDTWYKLEEMNNHLLYRNHLRSVSQKIKKKNLKNITPNMIINFYNTYYSTQNTTITITGDYNYKKKLASIINTFESIKPKPLKIKNYSVLFEPKLSYTPIKDAVSSNIYLFFKLDKTYFSEEYFRYNSISDILTDGLESRLYKALRGRGLVYSVNSEIDVHVYNECLGYFIINTQSENKNIVNVVKIILTELNKLKKNKITSSEIEKLKNVYESEYITKINNNKITTYSKLYTKYFAWNRKLITLKTLLNKKIKINSELIRSDCVKIFDIKNMVISYGGNKNVLKNINSLCKILN